MTDTLYKFLDVSGRPFHGGWGTWHLPTDNEPGAWMPPIGGTLRPCSNGYHLCRATDLIHWLAPALYEAEYQGERVDVHDKVVVREARLLRRVNAWNERTIRLFACDCAERALPAYVEQLPGDERLRTALTVARQFANGEATTEQLDDAWYGAWGAARSPASDAARFAALAASQAAARLHPWAAAIDAADATSRDTERIWQSRLLLSYLRGEVPA